MSHCTYRALNCFNSQRGRWIVSRHERVKFYSCLTLVVVTVRNLVRNSRVFHQRTIRKSVTLSGHKNNNKNVAWYIQHEADCLRLLLLFLLVIVFLSEPSLLNDQSNRGEGRGRYRRVERVDLVHEPSTRIPGTTIIPLLSLSPLSLFLFLCRSLSLPPVTFVNTKVNFHVNVARPLQTRASAGRSAGAN